MPQRLKPWLGIEMDEVSYKEKAVSALGGAFGLFAIYVVSKHALDLTGARLVVASMGASAVLLFGVPHGQLSQPWPVIGGHTVAALVGVTVAKEIRSVELAAAVAVGLAIGVMHHLKCLHPPGGATALVAVIGGPGVTDLGYGFVVRPVLLNAVTVVAVAVVFNAAFPWRRYPAHWVKRKRPAAVAATTLTHEDVLAAVRSLDSFIDVTEDDLVALYEILAARDRQLG